MRLPPLFRLSSSMLGSSFVQSYRGMVSSNHHVARSTVSVGISTTANEEDKATIATVSAAPAPDPVATKTEPLETQSKEPYVPPKVWSADQMGGNKFSAINRPTAGARREEKLPKGKHPLQLYSLGTPNGQKVTILLEELLAAGYDAEYDAWLIDIMKGDQFGSDFVHANPNSKIPALLDYSGSSSSEAATRVFESGSILMHLSEKYENAFVPRHLRTEVLNWLFWQMGSAPFVGGGFGHFYAYADEKQEYPINRFAMETKRQLDVLDRQLASTKQYICGDEYTIADMAIFPWYGGLALGKLYGDAKTFLNIEQEYPNLIAWAQRIASRPAVQRGMIVNKRFGNLPHLAERHSASDIDEALLAGRDDDEGGPSAEGTSKSKL